uniref:Uncharacterized protein n=1 Tax=Medicago truncatula TaxID=3880 RepID=Q2HRL8_MEDTR|nr:hypothetical protein MtrDRAFT_AC158465g8v2 [Medicago truncatula]
MNLTLNVEHLMRIKGMMVTKMEKKNAMGNGNEHKTLWREGRMGNGREKRFCYVI